MPSRVCKDSPDGSATDGDATAVLTTSGRSMTTTLVAGDAILGHRAQFWNGNLGTDVAARRSARVCAEDYGDHERLRWVHSWRDLDRTLERYYEARALEALRRKLIDESF